MAKTKTRTKKTAEPVSLPVSSVGIIARIWDEAGDMPPDAAHHILGMKFSEADVARMHEFSERNGLGTITKDELAEWDEYLLAGCVMSILQSKARMALCRATPGRVDRG